MRDEKRGGRGAPRPTGNPFEDDAGDTVRVAKADLADLEELPLRRAAPPSPDPRVRPLTEPTGHDLTRPQKRYPHTPSSEDLTPLPPPRALASVIADEGSAAQLTPPPTTGEEPSMPSLTGPLPLPPAPAAPRPAPQRPLERASLGPRRIAFPGPLPPSHLRDPVDARWTLTLRSVGGVLWAIVAATLLVKIAVDVGAGEAPTGSLLTLALLLLGGPAVVLAVLATVARARHLGIAVGPEQLSTEWQTYREVAIRLGLAQAPPLLLYEATPAERRLLSLARRRCVVVTPRSATSVDELQLAVGRELGAYLLGHDEPIDTLLLFPVRALFFVLTGWLRPLGLAASPELALRRGRRYSLDRAACVGAAQLGLVVDDILGGGQRALAARIDVAALGAQLRRSPVALRLALATTGEAAPVERVRRLSDFAAPHLARE